MRYHWGLGVGHIHTHSCSPSHLEPLSQRIQVSPSQHIGGNDSPEPDCEQMTDQEGSKERRRGSGAGAVSGADTTKPMLDMVNHRGLHHLDSDINMSNQDLAASYSEKRHDYERDNDNRGTDSDINMSNQDLAASYSEKRHDYERDSDNRGTVEYDSDATTDDLDLDWDYDLDDIEADSAGNLSSESDLASGYDGDSDSDELEELYDGDMLQNSMSTYD